MAYASFPRLIVEMALLKAALLAPLVPVQELIEKIKALETAAVHTPALPWEASRVAAAPAPQYAERQGTAPPRQPQPAAAAVAVTQPASAGDLSDWGRFVAFANE